VTSGRIVAAFLGIAAFLAFASSPSAQDRCPGVALANDFALPFEAVEIAGLSLQDETAVFALIESDGDEALSVAEVSQDREGAWQLFAPPAPGAPWQGGTVLVTIADGTIACGGLALTIAPLPRADGAADIMMTSLRQSIDSLAAIVGVDPQALRRADFESGDPLVEWLHVLSYWVDGEGEPNSLMASLAQLHGEASEDEATAEAMALLDSYIVLSGELETAAGLQVELMLSGMRAQEFYGRRGDLRPRQRTVFHAQAQTGSAPLVGLQGTGLARAIAPKTPEELAAMLEMQAYATGAGKPAASRYLNMAGLLLGAAGAGFEAAGERAIATGAGAGPGALSKGIGKTFTVGSHGLFVTGQVAKIVEGLFPAEFRSATINANPLTIAYSKDSPQEGRVTRFDVVARAKGLELTKMALDAALQFAPLGQRAGEGGAKIAQALNASSNNIAAKFGTLATKLGQLRQRAGGVTSATADNVVESKVKEKISGEGINKAWPDLVKIEPFDFPPVNVLKSGFYRMTARPQGILTLRSEVAAEGNDWIYFKGEKPGIAELEAFTDPGAFLASAEASATVEVEGPEVLIDPETAFVLPGETKRLHIAARSEGLDRADVSLEPAAVHRAELAGTEPHRFPGRRDADLAELYDVTGSTERADFPIKVTARSRLDPDVAATALLDVPKIDRAPYCVEADTLVRLVRDGGPWADVMDRVVWEVEGPGDAAAGSYFAPSEDELQGTAVVSVRARDGGHLIDRVSIRLGCACFAEAEIGGATQEFNYPYYMITPGPEERDVLTVVLSDNQNADHVMVSTQWPQPSQGFDIICNADGSYNGATGASQAALNLRYFTSGTNGRCEDAGRLMNCPDGPSPQVRLRPIGDGTFLEGLVVGSYYEFVPGAECPRPVEGRVRFVAGRIADTGGAANREITRSLRDWDDNDPSASGALLPMLGQILFGFGNNPCEQ